MVSISPNPTNGLTHIQINSPSSTDVRNDIYRFDGHHIQSFEEFVPKGEAFNLNWDGRGKVNSGLYFVRFSFENEIITKSIIVK